MKAKPRRLRVLVTRPRGEAELFAVTLAMRGHDAILAPLIEIVLIDGAAVDLSGAQAILFTSANGVRAFAHAEKRRDLPVFCVGDATAAAAKTAGFARVWSAAGDVDTLATLVRTQLKPADGALVHAAGTSVAGDLSGDLEKAGFAVRRVQLYRAEPAGELPDEAVEELRAGRLDVATFFSPRTAQTFARLVQAAELDETLESVSVLALAPGTLALLREEGCVFRSEIAAGRPNEASLLEALDRLAEEADVPPETALPKFELPPSGPAKPSAPKAAPPRASKLVPLALALVVAVFGILGWAYWQSTLTGSAEPGMRAIEQRVAGFDRRLAQVESRPAAPRVDVSPLEARIAALETRGMTEATAAPDAGTQSAIASLMAENRRLGDELARVQAEIGRLQGGIVEQASDRAGARRAEFRLALSQLREALAGGRAYDGELSLVRDLASDADLSALAPNAAAGIETRASLARRFGPLANAAVAAARVEQAPGLLGELVERAQSFLSIRRVGDVPGDSPTARVARAETRLAVDDLAGALAALEGVQGMGWSASLLPWIDTARRRLAAERAVAALAAAGS
ncbi:MAG: uroporphyrinogen-III synthase [Proteobacteria bacterium]|nr:uroporphyrinogen-III synthase [Pseudomonadota bacterium]